MKLEYKGEMIDLEDFVCPNCKERLVKGYYSGIKDFIKGLLAGMMIGFLLGAIIGVVL